MCSFYVFQSLPFSKKDSFFVTGGGGGGGKGRGMHDSQPGSRLKICSIFFKINFWLQIIMVVNLGLPCSIYFCQLFSKTNKVLNRT